MLNAFIIKKWAALMTVAFVSTICFAIGTIFYNFWIGLGGFFLGSLVSILLGIQLLKNPFSGMLEGKGILTFDMSSTGIITPFLVTVNPPYINGMVNGKKIQDTFDRNLVHMMEAPIESALSVAEPIVDEDDPNNGGMNITLSRDGYNSARFALFQFPVLFYDSQIKSFITKDFLSDQEMRGFANHQVLYLNRKVEELTTDIKNFARHVVDLMQPAMNILGSPWFWVVLIIGVGILLALFAPGIISGLKGGMSPAIEAMGAAKETLGNAAINPTG